jgi:hypothetical protein
VINGAIKTKNQVGIEKCCPNEAKSGEMFCDGHLSRNNDKKNQATFTTDHGVVGGPYTANSKLYGSQYYLDLLKDGWLARPEDEAKAKAAVDSAISESKMPAKKEGAPKVPRVKKTKEVNPDVEASTEEKPKKKTMRVSKKKAAEVVEEGGNENPVEPTPPPVITKPTGPVMFREKMTAPKVYDESQVKVVKVKKTRVDGKEYYWAPSTDKLYSIMANGGFGYYKGRYVAPTEEGGAPHLDTSYPDSDVEVDY